MAPAISHPHIVHVLILRDQHAKLMEQLAEELKKDDGEQQILAAITQAMDPNAQVAVPLSVAAANVEKEATPASKENDDSKEKEEEEDVKKEAQGRSSSAGCLRKPAPAVKGGKKGKAAAKGKKGAKGKKKAAEEVAPATESGGQKRRGC